jgi:hypothetical protein
MGMKKLLCLLSIVLIFSFFNLAFAETQMLVNEKGEVRTKVSENWRALTEAEKKAVANPNQEFVVGSPELTRERISFFHYVLVKKYSEIVIFDGVKLKTLSEITTKRGEKRFVPYVIFLLIGISAMLYLSYRVYKIGWHNLKKGDDLVFAAASIFVFAAVLDAWTFSPFAVGAALIAFVVSVPDKSDAKGHNISSAIFCVASIIAIVV